MAFREQITKYLDETRTQPLTDPDEHLHLDSLQFIRLTSFLQDDLGIDVQDDEITEENFKTLNSLCALIQRVQERAAHSI